MLPGVREKSENDKKPVVNSTGGSVIYLHGDIWKGDEKENQPGKSIGKNEANKGFM